MASNVDCAEQDWNVELANKLWSGLDDIRASISDYDGLAALDDEQEYAFEVAFTHESELVSQLRHHYHIAAGEL